MLRNRFLGGASSLVTYAPDDGTGAGAVGAGGGGTGGGAGQGAAAAAAGAGSGAGQGGGSGAAAGAGQGAGAAGGAQQAGGQGGADGGAAAAAGATLAGGGTDPAKLAAQPAGKVPDNWRELLAGDDKAALKDLQKYTDLNGVYKALRTIQGDVSSGKLKVAPEALPASATEEQKAEYRKTHGLPDSPEAYVKGLALPDGVVIGEADKPLVTEFAKDLFAAGASQAEMNRAIASYYRLQTAAEGMRAEADGGHKQGAMETLMTEWGPGDYKQNINAVATLQANMPEEFRVALLSARTLDGRMLGNTPEYLRWAAELSRSMFPQASVVAASDPNPGKSIGDEISQIEAKMYVNGQPNPEYWRGDAGARMQARYRELVHARDQMAARGGKAA